MKNPNIKLGDLVKLEGLEKPQEDLLKVELGGGIGKSPKLDQFGNSLGDLAGKVEDQGDFKTGEVTELLESMKKALVKELSPEKSAALLGVLKGRFLNKNKPYDKVEGVKWRDVEQKLLQSPEKLWSLNEMERTGGEPDIMEYDHKTGEYIFIDCSTEGPAGRADCVYDKEAEDFLKKNFPDQTWNSNAVSMASVMGIELLTEEEYNELQISGGAFDSKSWNWLKADVLEDEEGRVAFMATRDAGRQGNVRVEAEDAHTHRKNQSFRGSLRV